MQIPYTHSGVLASALAMHKGKAKDVMRAAGVSVPEGVIVHRLDAASRHVLPPPYVIKPVNEGSSVGVIIVQADRPHPPQEIGVRTGLTATWSWWKNTWPDGSLPAP